MRRFSAVGLLAMLAACGDAPDPEDPIPGQTTIHAAGRIYTLTGTVPAGARFTVSSVAGKTTAAIATNGSFSVQARTSGEFVDLYVEAEGMHPSLVRVMAGSPLPALHFVLVPRRWTVRGGNHDGTTVDISPDAAYRPPCTTPGDTNCDGFYPVSWTGLPRLWPRAALPVRVAFDHTRSHEVISAADSTEFWRIVERMNADYGTALFRAARLDEIVVGADNRPTQAVLVRVDTTLTGFGAWTNWWWNSTGEMYAAVMRPRRASFTRYPSLMTHELLHTHGFKHSCSWQTVMAGYGGCQSEAGLTAADVAYAQLAAQIEGVQRQSGAAHGLAAARDGERVITQGGSLPLPGGAGARLLVQTQGDSLAERWGDHAHWRDVR